MRIDLFKDQRFIRITTIQQKATADVASLIAFGPCSKADPRTPLCVRHTPFERRFLGLAQEEARIGDPLPASCRWTTPSTVIHCFARAA